MDTVDSDGYTPLMLAAKHGDLEVAKVRCFFQI